MKARRRSTIALWGTLLAILWATVPAWGAPWPGQELTLEQAVTLALERNLGYASATLGAEVSASATRQASDRLAPKVTVGGSYDRHLADGGDGPEVTATVSQAYPGLLPAVNLPGYPRPLGPVALAGLAEGQARGTAEQARRDLVFNVTQAYYGILKAGRLREVQAAALTASEAARKDTEAKANAGVATRVDLLRAELEVANAQLAVAKAVNTYSAAESALFSLLQFDPPAEPVRYPPAPAGLAPEGSLEALTAQALEKRPEVEGAVASLQRTISQLDRARLDTLPSVGVNGSYSGEKYSASSTWDLLKGDLTWSATASNQGLGATRLGLGGAEEDWSVGISVGYPLYDAGALTEAALQAKLQVTQAEEALAQVRNSVRAEVQAAWFELAEARLSVAAAQRAVGQSAEAVRLTRLRVENGVGTPAELLEANAQDLQVQVDLVQAEFAQELAVAKLKKAVGLL